MTAIVADPDGDRIYFTYNNVEVLNTDGSGRTRIISNPGTVIIVSLALDLKKR